MKITSHAPETTIDIDEPFLINAIVKYTKNSNFPSKIELQRIKATKVYYDEKIKQHDKINHQAQEQINELDNKTINARSTYLALLHELRDIVNK